MGISDRYYDLNYLTNCGNNWIQWTGTRPKQQLFVPIQPVILCYFEHV